MRITKAALANMTKSTKPRTIFDDELAGFGVRVFPSGRKTFILEYRPAGAGRTATKRRLSFGSVNEVPLDRARKAAKISWHAFALAQILWQSGLRRK